MNARIRLCLMALLAIFAIACDEATSQPIPCENATNTELAQGIPYQTDTEDGGSVVGRASINHFFADGDHVRATGTFTCGDTTYQTEYPVTVVDSTCESLILKIGPPTNPPGLVNATEIGPGTGLTSGSELRVKDLCDLATAYVSGDTQLLVDRLNETDKIQMGAVAGCCPWYKAIECSAAIISCMRVCAISPPPLEPLPSLPG
jgi:hypothetical protein